MYVDTNIFMAMLMLVILCTVPSCSGQADESDTIATITKFERTFRAIGNTDSDHRVERRKRGEVMVTCDLLPTKMSFNLTSFPCLVTSNEISYYNARIWNLIRSLKFKFQNRTKEYNPGDRMKTFITIGIDT